MGIVWLCQSKCLLYEDLLSHIHAENDKKIGIFETILNIVLLGLRNLNLLNLEITWKDRLV